MQAVILAAGEGQRLRPFTTNKPKVMVKVGNKPILEHVVESLRDAGILNIVMVVGYKKNRVIEYFKDGSKWNVKIKYVIQKKQLGTAHALKQAEKLVENKFLVIAGDNIVDSKTLESVSKNTWTIAYKKSDQPSKYGTLIISNNTLKQIIEKPEKPVSNLVNTGVYCFSTEIFDYIKEKTDLVSVINKLISVGYKFKCLEAETWIDVVYPWDIIKINSFSMSFSGKNISGKIERVTIIGDVTIDSGSVIKSGTYIRGPVIIGKNCEIGPNSVIMPSTSIGDHVKIGAFSYIENCVICDNVSILPNTYLKDSIVDRGCIIGPNFTGLSGLAEMKVNNELHKVKTGVFIGEYCNIGANVVLEPGTIVGNCVNITSLKTIRGFIPDNSTVV